MDMNLLKYMAFVKTVEYGSFTRAAEKLAYSQPTVSFQIKQLEQELDCILLKRSTRTMAMTDKGQVVYCFAKQALGGQAEMESELKRLDSCHRINLASTGCISFGLVPGILSKYRRKKSDVMFNLIQGQDKEIQAIAAKGGVVQVSIVRSFISNKPKGEESLADLLAHVNHIVKLVGVDHVGFGSDFDGGGGMNGCRNMSQMKNVTRALMEAGYSDEDIAKMWGGNTMRVFKAVEEYAAAQRK